MKITVLDAATLGKDISLAKLDSIGETEIFDNSSPEEVPLRITDSDVVIINKIKLNESNLCHAKKLRLICVAATGYDNIDVAYCKSHNIAVSNVKGYSTDSVALLTVSMALSLVTHLNEYNDFVKTGEYTKSGIANRLVPVYHELAGMTWGIVGLGNIGKKVAKAADAFGCHVIANKRTKEDGYEIVDLETLFRTSDIISVHVPLTQQTNGMIDKKLISLMKKDAVLINVARGKVTDEKALAEAVKEQKIGGIGIDVYSEEPFPVTHPFYEIKDLPNVCLTPHNAWGAYEARVRCLDEMILNIEAFYQGKSRNRVDLM